MISPRLSHVYFGYPVGTDHDAERQSFDLNQQKTELSYPGAKLDFSPVVFEKLIHFWDELESYPFEDASKANLFLMETLARWLRADFAYWCGLLRVVDGEVAATDPLGGWRMRSHEPYRIPDVYRENEKELSENQDLAETVGTASIAIMKEAGIFRIRCLRELVNLSEYEQTEHFQRFQMPYGLSDRIYVVTPLNDDSESCYCFELAGSDRSFTDEEANVVGTALRSVRWFQRRLFLSHGLNVSDHAFSSVERSIVLLLLTDKSEKEIAAEIGKAKSTTHNYITGIYRKLGVNNRAGLMSIWLG